MLVATSLTSIPKLKAPIALTIGNFDGVHDGHKHLIAHLKTLGTPTLLTFTNHTKAYLTKKEVPLLSSFEEKLTLLENEGIALVIALAFTQDIADQSYQEFLSHLKHHLPFDHLLIGEGDCLGKDRTGTPERLITLGKKLGYSAHFLPKLKRDGDALSSTILRETGV